jgi:hypothetical protein
MEAQGFSCFEVKWESISKGEIFKRIASNLGVFGLEMLLNGGIASAANLVGCIRLAMVA